MVESLVDVKLDAVGRAAEAFLSAKALHIKTGKATEEAEKALIMALRKSKRDSIKLEDLVLKVKFVSAKEKVQIIKSGR